MLEKHRQVCEYVVTQWILGNKKDAANCILKNRGKTRQLILFYLSSSHRKTIFSLEKHQALNFEAFLENVIDGVYSLDFIK